MSIDGLINRADVVWECAFAKAYFVKPTLITMSIALFILVTTCIITFCILYFFSRKNKIFTQEHLRNIASSKERLRMHKLQIEKRTENLHRYHLLRYNLGEALISQSEIIF